MAGLLDFLMGNAAGASPWGALYPTQSGFEADQAQQARDAAAAVLARRFRGASMGAPAVPDTFGAGATPFSFAGPGSMNVDPSQIAGPAPVIPPAGPIAQAPSPPATDLSSINRPAEPDSVVPVGSYKMPMYGEADEETATPAAAPGAARPAATPFSLAGNGGGGDRFMKATRGFMGNMGAGPIGALMGGLGALVTGQETDPSAIAQGKVNATGQALLSKGVAPADVQAAVNNPALMQALIAQYYGKDKYKVQQTGEDGLGRKTFQLFNETDGTLKPIPGASGAGGADAGIGDMTKKGPEYLATVPPAQRNTIQMMLTGDLPPPTSFALAKPYWQNMIAAARNVDPNFTETNWSARVAMQKSARGDGKIGQNNNALTTGIGHLKQLWDAIPALNNSDYSQTYNTVANAVSTEFGGTGATNFRSVANRVAPEIVKIWRGTGGAEADIKRDIESLNTSQTPSQLRGAISNIAGMMRSKLESNLQEYKATMGRDLPLTAEQQKTLAMIDQLEQAAGGGAGPAAAPAASAPKLAPGQSTTINGVPIRRVN